MQLQLRTDMSLPQEAGQQSQQPSQQQQQQQQQPGGPPQQYGTQQFGQQGSQGSQHIQFGQSGSGRPAQEVQAYACFDPRNPYHLRPYSYNLGPLGPEEVEVQVEYCGFGASDVEVLMNGYNLTRYPCVPGQEVIGRIVGLGSKAKEIMDALERGESISTTGQKLRPGEPGNKRQLRVEVIKPGTSMTSQQSQQQGEESFRMPCILKEGQRVGVGALSYACHSPDCSQCGYGCDQACPHLVLTGMGRLPEHEMVLKATGGFRSSGETHQGGSPYSSQQQQQHHHLQSQGQPMAHTEQQEHHKGCQAFAALGRDGAHYGGLGSHVRAHWAMVFPIPDAIPSEVAAPLLFRGLSVYAPLQMFLRYTARGKHLGAGMAQPGQESFQTGSSSSSGLSKCGHPLRVGIVGTGATAQLAIQFSKALNPRIHVSVFGTEISHDLANLIQRELGADCLYDLCDESRILRECNESFDLLILVTGHPPSNLDPYLSLLKRASTMVLFGFQSSLPTSAGSAMQKYKMSFLPNALIFHQWSIVGSYAGSRNEMIDMLDFAARNLDKIRPRIQLVPVDKVNELLEMFRRASLEREAKDRKPNVLYVLKR